MPTVLSAKQSAHSGTVFAALKTARLSTLNAAELSAFVISQLRAFIAALWFPFDKAQ